MNTANLYLLPDGTVKGLHTDLIDLSTMGRLQVERASQVEFDPTIQEWVVVNAGDGVQLFQHRRRKAALDFEREHYDSKLEQELACMKGL